MCPPGPLDPDMARRALTEFKKGVSPSIVSICSKIIIIIKTYRWTAGCPSGVHPVHNSGVRRACL